MNDSVLVSEQNTAQHFEEPKHSDTMTNFTKESDFEAAVIEEQACRGWEQSGLNKGQVYTRPEVVEFMLTAMGLNSHDALLNARILEPACGEGRFVLAMVDKLVNLPAQRPSVAQLENALLAVDVSANSLKTSKEKVAMLLEKRGYSHSEIEHLLNRWFIAADFLLLDTSPDFTHVVGNPPYIRLEHIPKDLLEKYRQIFSTMSDRADLYIPFFEKSLSLLKDGGRLSFICTDRWTKNTYGKSLRKLISEHYGLELFVDLYGTNAFEQAVMTYPAITQIKKGRCSQTVIQHGTDFSVEEAHKIASAIQGEKTSLPIRQKVVNGDKPWLLGSIEKIDLVRKLEERFPLLEDTACKVFIGAATGSNKIYIVDADKLGSVIEEERLLPVVTARELKNDAVEWRGKYLISTYDENGVINLDDYPRLSAYLHAHEAELSQRHIAKKDSANWFKTIDRVYKTRAQMEKLLIPDISSNPIVLYDKGKYHPNNSIYYICSEQWNLHALRVILLSNITKLFISAYSTKIANGYMRFQAQHLRKIRLPHWGNLDSGLQLRLEQAGKNNNTDLFPELACEAYQLNHIEQSIIGA